MSWYLNLVLSKEDAISQFFFLLFILFLGVALLSFNQDFGEPLSWRTIVLITSLAGLVSAYSFKVIYTLAISLLGIVVWWGAQGWEWIAGKDIKIASIFVILSFLALLFYTIGHLHERDMKWKRFALVYLILGLIFISGALFFFSTKPGLDVLANMTKGGILFGSWQLAFSFILLAILLIGSLIYGLVGGLISGFEAGVVILLALIFGAFAFLSHQDLFIQAQGYSYYYTKELSSTGVFWAVVFNFLVFFEILGLIFSGYLRRESWLINLGAIGLFLLIAVKYFDWFFEFLDKSLFFIGAGILLLAVGWLMEKSRRRLISDIKTS